MLRSTTDQMIAHLEFLGYEITRLETLVAAKHKTKMGLILEEVIDGAIFSNMFEGSVTAKNNKVDYLTWINELNRRSIHIRFYTNEQFQLSMESWYPNLYDKYCFGQYIDTLYRNFGLLIGDHKEASKF